MANNIAVSVTADVADLTAKMAVAKATMQDVGKTMREVAREVAAGDTTAETKTRLLQVSEAYSKASNEAALYARQTRSTAVAVNDNTGQMRAGMQNLGFQLQDVAVQFASGQRAGVIFAQQLPQVAGALTQMAQAGGNATGILGRFASFMSGPWGVAVGIAAAVLPSLIAKLFETGETADVTASKLRNAADAARELAGASNDMKLNQAKMDLNKLTEERINLENITKSKPFARDPNAGILDQNYQLGGAKRRIAELKQLELEQRNIINLADEQNAELDRKAAAAAARASSGSRGRGTTGTASGSNSAAAEAKREADAAIQASQAANQQIEALAEDRYQTEAELSRIALRSKIDDIDAEQSANLISSAQAVEAKATVVAQIEAIDRTLQAKLFAAKLDQLEADRRLHKEGTAEYIRYTQQIEQLQAKHLNRLLVLDRTAAAQERAARKQAQTAELIEMQRAEEQKRSMMTRAFQPFAASIARMVTLQRGFLGTMNDIWGSMVGIVNQAVTRMITIWLVGLAAQEAASDRQHAKQVVRDAKQAASGAYKAVVGIPIVGPILAPIAAAAAFAGVMAFSAEDGWDVPGGGGAGIDGRGGRPAIIHPREMVLPAQIADSVRALPNGLAGATAATASLRGASASVADINSGALSSPQMRNRGGQAGSRRSRGGNSGAGGMTFNINAVDARGIKRLFMDHNSDLAAALRKHVRDGGRG